MCAGEPPSTCGGSARALLGLAEAYRPLGRNEEAETYQEKALEAVDQQLELQPLILETPV